jgi:hypothetical protein
MQFVYAAASDDYANAIVDKVKAVIIYPLITLMFIIAMIVFLWGVFEYVRNGADESARSEGRRHMIYGIIGFVVMTSAVAILSIARGTFGV